MFTKDELKEISKNQEYVFVLDHDELKIIKYETTKIDFNSGSEPVLDLPDTFGEITVFQNEEDAEEELLDLINFEEQEAKDIYDSRIEELNNIKSRLKREVNKND